MKSRWPIEVLMRNLSLITVSNQLGDVDTTKLPEASALNVPGDKDGKVLMIRNQGKVEAYQVYGFI